MAVAATADSAGQVGSVLDAGKVEQKAPEAEVTAGAIGAGSANPLESVTDIAAQSWTLPGFNDTPAAIKLSGKTKTTSTISSTSTGGVPSGPGGWRGSVVGLARSYLGDPYVWGGESPGGFDCSGLVQYVYGKMGISMPRLSYDQAAKGKRISMKNAQPGDLIAYGNGPGGSVFHIAIYIGGGRIIEAPRPGRSVQVGRVHDTPRAFAVRIRK